MDQVSNHRPVDLTSNAQATKPSPHNIILMQTFFVCKLMFNRPKRGREPGKKGAVGNPRQYNLCAQHTGVQEKSFCFNVCISIQH